MQLAHAAYALPLLTKEEEADLLSKAANNDKDSIKKLYLSYARVVLSVARDFSRWNVPKEDLVQEGSIGLLKAIRDFNPERGSSLYSLAIVYIKFHIQEYVLNNFRIIKSITTKAHKKLFHNYYKLKDQNNKQIANTLNIRVKDVDEWESRMNWDATPIDEIDEPGVTSDTPESYLLLCEEEQRLEKVREAMERLSDRERFVIEHRFLLDNPRTLYEIKADLNVSHETVRNIEKRAITKLKTELQHLV